MILVQYLPTVTHELPARKPCAQRPHGRLHREVGPLPAENVGKEALPGSWVKGLRSNQLGTIQRSRQIIGSGGDYGFWVESAGGKHQKRSIIRSCKDFALPKLSGRHL